MDRAFHCSADATSHEIWPQPPLPSPYHFFSASIDLPPPRPPLIMAPPLPEGRLPAEADIDLSVISRGLFSSATNTEYDSYITGKRGWVEFCEARNLDPLAVTAETGKEVARFFCWRTDSLLKGKSMGEQLRAAMRAHFAPTRGLSSWSVITLNVETIPPTFSGNPALSDDMTAMYKGHAITRARRGELKVRRVDPIEPCHLLRCWSKHFAGRTVDDIDPQMLMAYSSTLLCANILLRYDELVMLRYVCLLSFIAVLQSHLEGVSTRQYTVGTPWSR